MTRTFQRIQDDIYFSILQTPLSGLLTSTSKTAVWRLWVNIFSYAIWVHEQISGRNAENSRSQNLPNLKETILNYHDGLDLVWQNGNFEYNLTNVVDAAERKIINRCAVLEPNDGGLVVKIAKDNNGNLEKVSAQEKIRIKAYLKIIGVPGIKIDLISENADLLKSNLTVYVNPLIIDLQTGQLLSSATTIYPVKEAIDNYLKKLEFNGTFVKDYYRRTITDAEGVELVIVNSLESKYASYPFTAMGEFKLGQAGYYKQLDADLTIEYKPYVLVSN
jgi:hypothetical protein